MRKRQRTESLIQELASGFIAEHTTGKSLLTVVDVRLSSDQRTARVFVSVFPHEHEGEAQSFLTRQGREFRGYMMEHARLMHVPFMEFVVGSSVV
ncbi:MAG TPA: hypothetical protein DCZ54_02580 [Candidatus Vogelbacteria bacterium]|nr:hypothetical protein [Candidatus Vogelbacteria bacterium]